MVQLQTYLQELCSAPRELLIQPDIKHQRLQHDKKIREDQELESGALLQAVLEPGQDGGECPKAGDLVYVHVTISPAVAGGADLDLQKEEALWSTRAEEGGSGAPLVFAIEKGTRAPRAWEVVLQGMRLGQRSVLNVRPSYGYLHPDCQMEPPPGVDATQQLIFDLQLVQVYSNAEVRPCGLHGHLFKRVLKEGSGWESLRPPCEVNFHVTLRALACDGKQLSGRQLFSTKVHDSFSASTPPLPPHQPLSAQLGAQQLPCGIAEAIGQMSKHEHAVFILPASAMLIPEDNACSCSALANVIPPRAEQVEAELELVSLVQVRDITGTGEVLKRKLREGTGEFPIDCPMHDTRVRIRYRVRPVRGGVPGAWMQSKGAEAAAAAGEAGAFGGMEDGKQQGLGSELGHADASQAAGAEQFTEIDTGCGEAPLGLEMAVKLMVPAELALVSIRSLLDATGSQNRGASFCHAKYGYGTCDQDLPFGISPEDELDFEVELLDFDKEAHWQIMPMNERFALVERVKARANAQVRAGKHGRAQGRYLRILKLMDSTRDFETQDEIDAMDKLKVFTLSNLSLCSTCLGDYSSAVMYASKGLAVGGNHPKLFFRRGKALSLRGDYEEAEADFHMAAIVDPSCAADMEKEVVANQKRAKAAYQRQKSEMRDFLSRS